MIDHGKRDVLGVLVDAVDQEAAVDRVIRAAKDGAPYGVTALAVHGIMTGVDDAEHRYRLNRMDLVTPDGQPVRWALNLMYGARLPDRVYGPKLMLQICDAAARQGLPIYLYGNEQPVLDALVESLQRRFPGLAVAGAEPSRFRRLTSEEKAEVVERVRRSGAAITFVGLGCPRQEVFAYEFRGDLSMPTIAVGAAFDYHAGVRDEPPELAQRLGLQWLWRLVQEPRRLWHRYTVVNARYLWLVALQLTGISRRDPGDVSLPSAELRYG